MADFVAAQYAIDEINSNINTNIVTQVKKKRRFRIAHPQITSSSTARTDLSLFELENTKGGYIHYFYSEHTGQSLSRMIFYADGVRMDSFRMISTGVVIVYATPDYLLTGANYTRVLLPELTTFGSVSGLMSISTSDFSHFLAACGSEQDYSAEPENPFNSQNAKYFVPMPEPLRFDESFKIEIPSMPANATIKAGIIYTLDE